MKQLNLIFLILSISHFCSSSEWISKTKIPMSKDEFNSIEVSIISNNLVYVSSREGIWYTTDKADTWNSVEIPESIEFINDFYAINSTNIWIATSQGAYFSTDNGSNWDLISNSAFSVIYFENESVGYGCSFNSESLTHYISKTTDKGETWTSVLSTYLSYFIDIQFAENGIGFAIGRTIGTNDIGHIFKTVNYGENWQKITFPSSINHNKGYYSGFRTLHVYDQNTIYVGGDQLIKSIDSGENWLEIYDNSLAIPRSIVVNDLFLFNSNDGYFANYSSSPQRLYRLINSSFDPFGSEITTNEGALNIDFNLDNNLGLAVSSNGNSWINSNFDYEPPTSIISSKEMHSFAIFPNPASDYINFNSIPDLIEIYNSKGELISSSSNKTKNIYIGNISPGIYIAKLFFNDAIVDRKFVIH